MAQVVLQPASAAEPGGISPPVDNIGHSARDCEKWLTTGEAAHIVESLNGARTETGHSRTHRIFSLLDIAGLAFNAGEMVSRGYLNALLKAPPSDYAEIRDRQAAVREIFADTELFHALDGLYSSPASIEWRSMFFDRMKDEIGDYLVHPTIEKTMSTGEQLAGSRVSTPEYVEQADRFMRLRRAFIEECGNLIQILARARSTRLRQLRYVLAGLFSDSSPYGLAQETREFMAANEPQERLTALQHLTFGADLKKLDRLERIEKAYADLAALFDLAREGRTRPGMILPEILNPQVTGRPAISVRLGHLFREFLLRRGLSVPNSIALGGTHPNNGILSGANGEGKTSTARLLVGYMIRAAVGGFVPAEFFSYTPLRILIYEPPMDDPAAGSGHWQAEASELKKIYDSVTSPFTFLFVDESLTGTIKDLHEDAESVFLTQLAKKGALSLTTTHADATLNLASEKPDVFRNYHVENHLLTPGRRTNHRTMYERGARVLDRAGWPPEWVDEVLDRGRKKGIELPER